MESILTDNEVSECAPAAFRYHEARYFLEKFREACGEPGGRPHSHFLLVSYFDAFLFCLVSVEEMVSETDKEKLGQNKVFKFFKAARNVTTHHSVLAAPNQKGAFPRPVSRKILMSQGPFANFSFSIDMFREVFDKAGADFPRGKDVFEAGKEYLEDLEQRGDQQIFLEDVMQEGLDAVKEILSL